MAAPRDRVGKETRKTQEAREMATDLAEYKPSLSYEHELMLEQRRQQQIAARTATAIATTAHKHRNLSLIHI